MQYLPLWIRTLKKPFAERVEEQKPAILLDSFVQQHTPITCHSVFNYTIRCSAFCYWTMNDERYLIGTVYSMPSIGRENCVYVNKFHKELNCSLCCYVTLFQCCCIKCCRYAYLPHGTIGERLQFSVKRCLHIVIRVKAKGWVELFMY